MRSLYLLHLNRLACAPFLGLLAGLLLNRARGGADGYALLAEMAAGAILATFGGMILANLSRLVEDQHGIAAARARQLAQVAQSRHQALIDAEAARYRTERVLYARAIHADRRAAALAEELKRQQGVAFSLQQALAGVGRVSVNEPIQSALSQATARIERLEAESRLVREARERLEAIESAQQALRDRQFELGRKAEKEAEEVKASLLQFTVTDSQRRRNLEAQDNDQSGRIIELESRIQRLARELEKLSARQVAPAPAGAEAPQENDGAAARMGFLRAMLDANKTLRKTIQEAA